jgi:hypothetical protein
MTVTKTCLLSMSVAILGCGSTVASSAGPGSDSGAMVDGAADIQWGDLGEVSPRGETDVDAGAIGLPPGVIGCGGTTCARGEACVACSGEPLRCYARNAEPNQRPDCQFRAYCDTDDDCGAGERCLWVEGDFENFRCGVRGDVVCRISLRCDGDTECVPCFGRPQRCVDPLAAHSLGRGVFPRVCRL